MAPAKQPRRADGDQQRAGRPSSATAREGKVYRLRANGSLRLRRVVFMIGSDHAHEEVTVSENDEKVIVADLDGQLIAEFDLPEPGIKYVGNGQPRGRRRTPAGTPHPDRVYLLRLNGALTLRGVTYMIGARYARQHVTVVDDGTKIIVVDQHGETIAEHTHPPAGTKYVGLGQTRGWTPRAARPSPMS